MYWRVDSPSFLGKTHFLLPLLLLTSISILALTKPTLSMSRHPFIHSTLNSSTPHSLLTFSKPSNSKLAFVNWVAFFKKSFSLYCSCCWFSKSVINHFQAPCSHEFKLSSLTQNSEVTTIYICYLVQFLVDPFNALILLLKLSKRIHQSSPPCTIFKK